MCFFFFDLCPQKVKAASKKYCITVIYTSVFLSPGLQCNTSIEKYHRRKKEKENHF